MKGWLGGGLIVVASLVTLLVSGASPVAAQTSGGVAAYAFDEGTGTTSADASGNGHPATLVNGPGWFTGQFGAALSFNGFSSYATTGLTTTLPTWTISGWVQSPAAPTSATPSGPIHREANYQINWNHPSPAFQGAAAVRVGGGWYAASFGSLAANTWYYLAATYDGQTLNAYTNGVLVTSNPAPSGPADADPNPLTLGRHAALAQFFQGSVDNVRIYNAALSQAEIQADMNTPVGGGTPPTDTTPPTVAITSPTTAPTFTTATTPLTLGGTAADDVGVTQVSWVNDRGGSGSATGTTTWTASGIPLQAGSNVLTVTARDAAGNTATATLTVTYTPADTASPTVAITTPTSAPTYATSTTPLALAGTAADNVGVTQVSWVNDRGGSGTATGTTTWSVSGIALQTGTNVLTVTARDAAGNTAIATLTVTYTAADTTGPAVTITSHTNNQAVNLSPITVAGTASDSGLGNNGISSVTVNATAATGGTAAGSATASWSRSITLSPGANTITVVAKDNSSAQNATTVQITVVYDPTSPTVSITTPTTAPTFTTATSPITLAGTASDDVGVTQVTWSNSQGGSGTATGTTSWSVSSVALQPGTNVLTVTARDAVGNTATATLTVSYTASSGQVAAYAFDEGTGTTSADASGNGHPATLVNGPGWFTGQFGAALSFNGFSSYATTGLTTTLPTWTISGWVQSPAAPTSATPSGPIHREANYQINWNHPSPAFQGAAAVRVGGGWYAASFGSLAANTWYYLAATYDGQTLNAYTNGVLVTSNPAPSGPADADPNPLTLGRHAALAQFFQGSVDNVRIYNAALSQAEIQADMNTPVGGGTPPTDTTPPTVAITSPTTAPTFTTATTPLTLGGTAADDVGVTQVSWVNDRGGSGSATGTTTWTASGIPLQAGSNVLTVTARDAAGNTATATLTVTYTPADTTSPTVAITTPTSAPTYATSTTPLALAGTAADNVGVTQVSWVNDRGGSGTATGTTTWSVSGIALQTGTNVLTVTARDAAGNTAIATLTVTYTAADTTGPAVTITSHTNNQAVNLSPITVAGTASDSGLGNNGISSVTVNGTAATGGTAAGSATASWSRSITLSPGANTITVVAKDNSSAQNATTVQITVVYDPTSPTVSITTPTTAPTFTTATSPITLAGTASDDVGVTQVTWSNSQGGSGTATGTTSWSVSSVALQPGTNVLTVTARDAVGNTATATLTVSYTASSGQVAAYAFDEGTGTTSADASGNGHPATLVNGPSWFTGQFGAALSFNGFSSYATTGLTTTLPTWTISGWVHSPVAPTAAAPSGPIHREANYQINWNHPSPAFQGAAALRVGGGWYAASFGSLAANTWYYLAATYDGQTLNAYTNGVLVTSNPAPSGPADADPNPLTLGRHAALAQFFQGSVDNVRVYNRALSPAEIQADMNAPVGGGTPPTDTTPPTVAITSPTTAPTFTTATTPLTLGGTAADDVGVTQVSWVNDRGGSGSATGTTTWTASGIPLQAGSNVLTVTARDAAGNTATATLTVTYSPTGSDTSGPTVAITSHTNNQAINTSPITVTGTASDSGMGNNGISSVTVNGTAATGGTAVGSSTANWSQSVALSPGANTITVVAKDNSPAQNATTVQITIMYDPTPPTVAITNPTSGSTVSGPITVTATASDNVGVVGVQFRLDGAPLGGEVTSPPYSTAWNTSSATDGSHLLSAVARDAAGNQTTVVISITVSNQSGPAQVGQWSAPFSLPIKAIHMVLFRTGEVLMWDAFSLGNQPYVWNPTTGVFTSVPTTDNIFCSGPALLADGTALIAGGHGVPVSGPVQGLADVNRFDPITKTWSPAAPMAFPRWYPTATTLPDGRVLVVSGATTCFTCIGDIPEVYDPATDSWTQWETAQLSMPLYPHMFVLPDGRILYASSTEGVVETRTLDLETQTWTMIDPNPVAGGSSAMYRPGVILKSGSPGAPGRIPTATSLNETHVLDMSQPSPAWRAVGPMQFGRTFHTLTVLPTGDVLATGGSQTNDPASQPVYAAETWSPQTETWSTMSSGQIARTYHQVALLLPDGRVLVTGGGGCCGAPDQFNAEIFSPPYLFKGSRPAITSVSPSLGYGAQFFVGTPDAATIASVALVRLGAVTHQFDRSQNYVPLSFTAAANQLSVQMPPNGNVAPPGDYMLFIVNTSGVPSVAAMVTVH